MRFDVLLVTPSILLLLHRGNWKQTLARTTLVAVTSGIVALAAIYLSGSGIRMILSSADSHRDSLSSIIRNPSSWLLSGGAIRSHMTFYTPFLFSISRERGYGEFFQYMKAFWLVLLFAWYAFRTRQATYLFWSAIFGYLLIDDAAGIHEKAGNMIRLGLAIPAQFGLRGADFGELTFYALMMGSLLLLLGATYYFGTASFRRDSIYLMGLLGIFAFFASIVDVLHMFLRETDFFRLIDVVEDGGEMVMMSIIVWFAILTVTRGLQKGDEQVT